MPIPHHLRFNYLVIFKRRGYAATCENTKFVEIIFIKALNLRVTVTYRVLTNIKHKFQSDRKVHPVTWAHLRNFATLCCLIFLFHSLAHT